LGKFGFYFSPEKELFKVEYESYQKLRRELDLDFDFKEHIPTDGKGYPKCEAISKVKKALHRVPTDHEHKEFLFSQLLDNYKRHWRINRLGKQLFFVQMMSEMNRYALGFRFQKDSKYRGLVTNIDMDTLFVLNENLVLHDPERIFIKLDVWRQPNALEYLQGTTYELKVGDFYHTFEEPDKTLNYEDFRSRSQNKAIFCVDFRTEHVDTSQGTEKVVTLIESAFTNFYAPDRMWLTQFEDRVSERIEERIGKEVEERIDRRKKEQDEIMREIIKEVWKETYGEKYGVDPPNEIVEIGKEFLIGVVSGIVSSGIYEILRRRIQVMSPTSELASKALSDIRGALERNQEPAFLRKLEERSGEFVRPFRFPSPDLGKDLPKCKFCGSPMNTGEIICGTCEKCQI
jgi:hypothetical protein